ncbi:putative leader peptide [Pseudactinotalea suaedae]
MAAHHASGSFTSRRAVDLLRVASALCRHAR